MQLVVWPVLVGRKNSLTSEFRSLHHPHGLGAVADAQGRCSGRRGEACGARDSGGPEWHARDG